jgi:hypothetical protein
MEYTNIDPLEFTMSCIVCIGYIVGKVWIHYKPDNDTKKPNNTNGVIRRGTEWPE